MKPSIRVQLFGSPNLNVCFFEVDLKSEADCTSCKLNEKGNVSLREESNANQ